MHLMELRYVRQVGLQLRLASREHLTMVLTRPPPGVFGRGLDGCLVAEVMAAMKLPDHRDGRCIRVTYDYRFCSNMNDEVQDTQK